MLDCPPKNNTASVVWANASKQYTFTLRWRRPWVSNKTLHFDRGDCYLLPVFYRQSLHSHNQEFFSLTIKIPQRQWSSYFDQKPCSSLTLTQLFFLPKANHTLSQSDQKTVSLLQQSFVTDLERTENNVILPIQMPDQKMLIYVIMCSTNNIFCHFIWSNVGINRNDMPKQWK